MTEKVKPLWTFNEKPMSLEEFSKRLVECNPADILMKEANTREIKEFLRQQKPWRHVDARSELDIYLPFGFKIACIQVYRHFKENSAKWDEGYYFSFDDEGLEYGPHETELKAQQEATKELFSRIKMWKYSLASNEELNKLRAIEEKIIVKESKL